LKREIAVLMSQVIEPGTLRGRICWTLEKFLDPPILFVCHYSGDVVVSTPVTYSGSPGCGHRPEVQAPWPRFQIYLSPYKWMLVQYL